MKLKLVIVSIAIIFLLLTCTGLIIESAKNKPSSLHRVIG